MQSPCCKKHPVLPSALLAVVCALLIFLGRTSVLSSLIRVGPAYLPFTDYFIIVSTGLGGIGSGLVTFVLVFIAETFRVGGTSSLYTVVTYLVLALLTAWFSARRWFASAKKAALGCAITTAVLALCWFLTFTLARPTYIDDLFYNNLPYWRLLLEGLPETAAAFLTVGLFFRFAPERVKLCMGNGWLYVACPYGKLRENQVLSHRITAFSMLETLVLYVTALICTNLISAGTEGVPFGTAYMLLRWRENLRLALMMMCVGVPVAYLFNRFVLQTVVMPINEMSGYMDTYSTNGGRPEPFPDLDIHTGDEVERLYRSLGKMVDDIGRYIDHIMEQEHKTAHLTRDFMLALSQAVDAKDHYTSGHSLRVAQYSREIAKRCGWSEERQEEIYMLGLLHDIGKIGVPEAIINKQGRLTDEEFQKIKEHPGMGYEILKNVKELPSLAIGARWHHERFDGRGYPDGLAGGNIPIEARIIGVADAYDAMTSNRAYSSVRPQAQVRSEIERCSGSQFDPEIAKIMLDIIDDDVDYQLHE